MFICASKNGGGWQTLAVFAFVLPMLFTMRALSHSISPIFQLNGEMHQESVRKCTIFNALLDSEAYGNSMRLSSQALFATSQNVED